LVLRQVFKWDHYFCNPSTFGSYITFWNFLKIHSVFKSVNLHNINRIWGPKCCLICIFLAILCKINFQRHLPFLPYIPLRCTDPVTLMESNSFLAMHVYSPSWERVTIVIDREWLPWITMFVSGKKTIENCNTFAGYSFAAAIVMHSPLLTEFRGTYVRSPI
jgi:hypothetical protein